MYEARGEIVTGRMGRIDGLPNSSPKFVLDMVVSAHKVSAFFNN
jgi:hypothetical protein